VQYTSAVQSSGTGECSVMQAVKQMVTWVRQRTMGRS
jgi:hypothetical protein